MEGRGEYEEVTAGGKVLSTAGFGEGGVAARGGASSNGMVPQSSEEEAEPLTKKMIRWMGDLFAGRLPNAADNADENEVENRDKTGVAAHELSSSGVDSSRDRSRQQSTGSSLGRGSVMGPEKGEMIRNTRINKECQILKELRHEGIHVEKIETTYGSRPSCCTLSVTAPNTSELSLGNVESGGRSEGSHTGEENDTAAERLKASKRLDEISEVAETLREDSVVDEHKDFLRCFIEVSVSRDVCGFCKKLPPKIHFSIVPHREYPFYAPEVRCLTKFCFPSIADGRDLAFEILQAEWSPFVRLETLADMLPRFIDTVMTEANSKRFFGQVGAFQYPLRLDPYLSDSSCSVVPCLQFASKSTTSGPIPRYAILTDSALICCRVASVHVAGGAFTDDSASPAEDTPPSDWDFQVVTWTYLASVHTLQLLADNVVAVHSKSDHKHLEQPPYHRHQASAIFIRSASPTGLLRTIEDHVRAITGPPKVEDLSEGIVNRFSEKIVRYRRQTDDPSSHASVVHRDMVSFEHQARFPSTEEVDSFQNLSGVPVSNSSANSQRSKSISATPAAATSHRSLSMVSVGSIDSISSSAHPHSPFGMVSPTHHGFVAVSEGSETYEELAAASTENSTEHGEDDQDES